jgi:G protein-coupled receptor 157
VPAMPCHSNLHQLLDYIVQKDIRIRAVVGVTCSLSIIGSLLIILSYVCFKDLRTRARYILVHLSLMDLILAVSNLVGIAGNFDQRSIESNSNYNVNESLPMKFNDTIYCRIQGLFTLYSTLSSILWTIFLAVFVYILVTAGNPKRITKFLMLFCYLLCYGLPLLPSLWAFFSGKVGYAPLQSSGWCALKSHHVYVSFTSAKNGSDDHIYCVSTDVYTNFFAYNLWIVMAFGVIVFTYLSVHCHITNKVGLIGLYVSFNNSVVVKFNYVATM